jgi:predicted HTH transcriptional regulator
MPEQQLELLETDWLGITKPATNEPVRPLRHVHDNSMAAYRGLQTEIKGRRAAIVQTLIESRHSLTDRQIMERLGFADMNAVRPRISELVKSGMLREVGGVQEDGRAVRLVWFASATPSPTP